MKKLFLALIVLLSTVMGYSQDLLRLPETGDPVNFDSNQGTISNAWDLKSLSDAPYYFRFYDGAKPAMVLQLNKVKEGISLEPVETNGKNILVEFWKDDKVVQSYYETKNKLKGPLPGNYPAEEMIPKRVYSKTLISGQKQIWPILVLMVTCCLKVDYRYQSGKPPKQSIKVIWNCDCLSTGIRKLKFKVDNKIIEADFITYTIQNVTDTQKMKMSVAR